jgi:hypothetical protein
MQPDVSSGYGTKIEALIADLTLIRNLDVGKGEVTKSIVFSQFTSMLDLCQVSL